MRALERRVPPPVLMIVISAAMGAAKLGSHPPMLPLDWRWGLAGLCFVAAGVFAFPAFAAFGRAKTTADPVHVERASSLVTTGIYRLTRNPMYVALSLLLCAWAAWIARPLSMIGPVAFILFITRFQIAPEERALTMKFGDAYDDYRRSVRRWF